MKARLVVLTDQVVDVLCISRVGFSINLCVASNGPRVCTGLVGDPTRRLVDFTERVSLDTPSLRGVIGVSRLGRNPVFKATPLDREHVCCESLADRPELTGRVVGQLIDSIPRRRLIQ